MKTVIFSSVFMVILILFVIYRTSSNPPAGIFSESIVAEDEKTGHDLFVFSLCQKKPYIVNVVGNVDTVVYNQFMASQIYGNISRARLGKYRIQIAPYHGVHYALLGNPEIATILKRAGWTRIPKRDLIVKIDTALPQNSLPYILPTEKVTGKKVVIEGVQLEVGQSCTKLVRIEAELFKLSKELQASYEEKNFTSTQLYGIKIPNDGSRRFVGLSGSPVMYENYLVGIQVGKDGNENGFTIIIIQGISKKMLQKVK